MDMRVVLAGAVFCWAAVLWANTPIDVLTNGAPRVDHPVAHTIAKRMVVPRHSEIRLVNAERASRQHLAAAQAYKRAHELRWRDSETTRFHFFWEMVVHGGLVEGKALVQAFFRERELGDLVVKEQVESGRVRAFKAAGPNHRNELKMLIELMHRDFQDDDLLANFDHGDFLEIARFVDETVSEKEALREHSRRSGPGGAWTTLNSWRPSANELGRAVAVSKFLAESAIADGKSNAVKLHDELQRLGAFASDISEEWGGTSSFASYQLWREAPHFAPRLRSVSQRIRLARRLLRKTDDAFRKVLSLRAHALGIRENDLRQYHLDLLTSNDSAAREYFPADLLASRVRPHFVEWGFSDELDHILRIHVSHHSPTRFHRFRTVAPVIELDAQTHIFRRLEESPHSRGEVAALVSHDSGLEALDNELFVSAATVAALASRNPMDSSIENQTVTEAQIALFKRLLWQPDVLRMLSNGSSMPKTTAEHAVSGKHVEELIKMRRALGTALFGLQLWNHDFRTDNFVDVAYETYRKAMTEALIVPGGAPEDASQDAWPYAVFAESALIGSTSAAELTRAANGSLQFPFGAIAAEPIYEMLAADLQSETGKSAVFGQPEAARVLRPLLTLGVADRFPGQIRRLKELLGHNPRSGPKFSADNYAAKLSQRAIAGAERLASD